MSKGIDFPSGISPNRRKYTPGNYPVKDFEGLNGAVTTLQYGNQKVDSMLDMVFTNIPDEKAYEIFLHYEEVNGGRGENGERYWAVLSKEISIGPMAGISSTDLSGVMAESQGVLRYRYAEPPTITSVFPGTSTVTVKLRGYMDGAKSL